MVRARPARPGQKEIILSQSERSAQAQRRFHRPSRPVGAHSLSGPGACAIARAPAWAQAAARAMQPPAGAAAGAPQARARPAVLPSGSGVDTLLRAAQCYGSTPPASRVGTDAVGAERAAQALQRVSGESVLLEPVGHLAVARGPRPSTALTTISQDSLEPCVSQNSTSASVFPVVLRPKASAVFATHSERRRATALFQASRLMQALPPQAEQWLLGDTNQVPAKARLKLVQAFMLKHGGPEGQNAAKAFRSWNLLTAYARANGIPDNGLPASAGLVAAVVASELERAQSSSSKRISQGGATVGAAIRDGFLFLQRMGGPFDAKTAIVKGAAAPAPTNLPRPRKHAGSLPIQVVLHLELLAGSKVWSVARTFSRALLISCVLHHIRLNDALNAVLWKDPDDPAGVIVGRTKTRSKDGVPLDLFAPAVGFSGELTWLEEHFAEMKGRDHALPAMVAPACGRVALATALAPGVASPIEARKAFRGLLAMPPLSLSVAEIAALNITTHSFHGTGPDMGRVLGFEEREIRALGHWLRDKNASATPRSAPGVAGHGRATGELNARGNMSLRYSQGVGRKGERAEQLTVRAKLLDAVRLALGRFGKPWSQLPRGIQDYEILLPA